MKMTKELIGIVGLGFVGGAVKESMKSVADLILVDKDSSKNQNNFSELFDCKAIFICVPSPEKTNGECDVSILIDTLKKLKDYNGTIISKTTAPPNIYKELNDLYPNLVHSPEFLTAANAVHDYLDAKYLIVGGSNIKHMETANKIIRLGQTRVQTTHYCTIDEASFCKYVINTFLATKVVFMNEMYLLSNELGVNWNKVRELIALDQRRIGNSHTQVPGFDNQLGFGGMCFPKDTHALLKLSEQYKIPLNVLDAAVKKNVLLRLSTNQ